MKNSMRILAGLVCSLALGFQAGAQPPGGKPVDNRPSKEKAKDFSNSSIVTRMMAFNKKNDGKLTKDEVTDPRLHRLFDQADANHDGVVTKDELLALAAKLEEEIGQGGQREGRGAGGPGGPGGRGPGGPGGPGGFGVPPKPGQVLPTILQDILKLTADQKKQLAELQKDVDGKLDKILTDEQKKQLKDLAGGPGGGARGPGGPRPGFRAPGAPDDRPPGGPGESDGPGARDGNRPGGLTQPGQILSDSLQERLKLTADQKKQLAELQKDVEAKLGRILTEEQKKQLKVMSEGPGRGRGGEGPGEGGPGGTGGRPPGGPGGPGSPVGAPRPGQVLSPFLVEGLKLSADQKKQLEKLQKEVDEMLDKILTDEQKKQVKEMAGRSGGRPGRTPGGRPPGGPPE